MVKNICLYLKVTIHTGSAYKESYDAWFHYGGNMARTGKKKKRGPWKALKIIVILMLVMIIVMVGGVFYLGYTQKQKVTSETEKIVGLDIDTEDVDQTIYTHWQFGTVEQTIKEYMTKYIDAKRSAQNIFEDGTYENLLSAANIEADPDLSISLTYIDDKRDEIDEVFGELSDMAKTENIMAAIEEQDIYDYFTDLYSQLMIDMVQQEYMYTDTEIDSAVDALNDSLDSREKALQFLQQNVGSFRVTDGKLRFLSDDLLQQYNELISAIE